MRIEYVESTGNPFGQFVVFPESKLDRILLHNFLQGSDYDMRFWLHGTTYGEAGIEAFNFGWIKEKKEV